MATTFLTPKNNAATTLAEALDDSELGVDVTDASVFPANGDCPFHITIDNEIMEVTGVANNTLTVTRGAESTTPAEHDNGKAVRLNITAEAISDLNAAVNAIESQSGFHAYRTVAQTIPATTWTKIEYNIEEYDTQGEYDHVTNFRFTATKAGKYLVTAICGLDALADGKIVTMIVGRNGVTVGWAGGRRLVTTSTGAAGGLCFSGSGIMNLAATDYIECWMYHTDTEPRDTPAEAYSVSFEVSRISD